MMPPRAPAKTEIKEKALTPNNVGSQPPINEPKTIPSITTFLSIYFSPYSTIKKIRKASRLPEFTLRGCRRMLFEHKFSDFEEIF